MPVDPNRDKQGQFATIESRGAKEQAGIIQVKDKLSQEERQAVNAWSRGKFKEIRNAQKNGISNELTVSWGDALGKAPDFNGIVFRNMQMLPEKVLDEIMEASTFKFNADSSCTKDSGILKGFMRGNTVTLEIRNSKTKDISELTEFNEQETIIRKNTTFNISKAKRTGNNVRVILIPSGEPEPEPEPAGKGA